MYPNAQMEWKLPNVGEGPDECVAPHRVHRQQEGTCTIPSCSNSPSPDQFDSPEAFTNNACESDRYSSLHGLYRRRVIRWHVRAWLHRPYCHRRRGNKASKMVCTTERAISDITTSQRKAKHHAGKKTGTTSENTQEHLRGAKSSLPSLVCLRQQRTLDLAGSRGSRLCQCPTPGARRAHHHSNPSRCSSGVGRTRGKCRARDNLRPFPAVTRNQRRGSELKSGMRGGREGSGLNVGDFFLGLKKGSLLVGSREA